nr:uncharacterized protein [Candida metapsilosis]
MMKKYLPLFPKPRQIRKTYLAIPFVLITLVLLHFLNTYDTVKQWSVQVIGNKLPISHYREKPITILPSDFSTALKIDHNLTANNNEIVKYHGSASALSLAITNQTYTPHPITLFASTPVVSIFEEETRADAKDATCDNLQLDKEVSITKSVEMKQDWKLIAKTLLNQITHDDSLKEIAGFFKGKLAKYIETNALNEKHFYKFAGTSVWLSKYGVHLMVSRLLFTQTARKANPQISLLYAQIYDENWQELTNVDLVLPIIDDYGERKYESVNFPRVMSIPFYHNSKKTKKRWYGPEDTRILLSKNEYGDEEPMIIFNSFHRQVLEAAEDANGEKKPVKYGFYRSMFMGYLFRYQRGKLNVDAGQDRRASETRYNKVVELRIEGQERQKIEKNWTPFINPSERKSSVLKGADEHMYIVYQWDNLKILKCELANAKQDSKCQIVYKQDSKDGDAKVGPVRGGTELIPIKAKSKSNLDQVWIGFLRAHIDKCGCGKAMYRPNFIVLGEKNGQFKLSYLSSSISFNMAVDGWKYADVQCARRDPNVLIPNGISMYEPKKDYLSLTLSVADKNDNLVHVSGIKKLVDELDLNWGEYSVSSVAAEKSPLISCVVASSSQFCKDYGLEQDKLGVSEAARQKAKEEAEAAEKAKAEKEKEKENGGGKEGDAGKTDDKQKLPGEESSGNQNADSNQQPPAQAANEQQPPAQPQAEQKGDQQQQQQPPAQQDEHPNEDQKDRTKESENKPEQKAN